MKKTNIFLIGMMGSGKTMVGKILSKKLKMNFIDIDEEIEEIMSMSIHEIFKEFGQKRFREMESSYFIEKSKQKGIVFSTGGGVVLKKENRQRLLNNGITILLDTTIYELNKRIKNVTYERPLINKSKNIQLDLLKIWEKRNFFYTSCANHIIQTDNCQPNIIVNKIIKILNEKN